jgi:hypothetical protein
MDANASVNLGKGKPQHAVHEMRLCKDANFFLYSNVDMQIWDLILVLGSVQVVPQPATDMGWIRRC